MAYVHERRVDGAFEETVERTRERLSDEGFGVLCEIDVREKLTEELGLSEFRDYVILGACNPSLAHEALSSEVALGALLPCNVVVSADDGDVVVAAVDPEVLLGVVDNDDLDPVAADVRETLCGVVDGVADADA